MAAAAAEGGRAAMVFDRKGEKEKESTAGEEGRDEGGGRQATVGRERQAAAELVVVWLVERGEAKGRKTKTKKKKKKRGRNSRSQLLHPLQFRLCQFFYPEG